MVYRRRHQSGPRTDFFRGRRAFAEIRPEDYDRLRDIVLDPKTLPATYDRWRERTENEKRDWKRRGRLAVSVQIDAEKLLAFCDRKGIQANVNAFHVFLEAGVRPVGS